MKKTLIIIAVLFATTTQAQSKDTTIQVKLEINQFRALLNALDVLIDSKKASKEVVELLTKSASILEADKPKEIVTPKKN